MPKNIGAPSNVLEITNLIIKLGYISITFNLKEEYGKKWPFTGAYLPKNEDILNQAIKYLTDESGFFTISCKNSLLVVPFEGGVFNIIVNDDIIIENLEGFDISDATNVLKVYRDLYNNFGVDEVFDREKLRGRNH
jgi:hypothetical protein